MGSSESPAAAAAAAKPRSPARGPQFRRRRTGSTSTSSSSVSTSSSTPSPSYNIAFQSHIPFSWEKLPGIPKLPSSKSPIPHPLPLPPPLRSAVHTPRKPKSDGPSLDPFAAALAECAKDAPSPRGHLDELFLRNGKAAAIGRRRRAGIAVSTIGDRFGLFNIYGSCKATCSVSDATIVIPRPGSRTGSYGLLNRRPG